MFDVWPKLEIVHPAEAVDEGYPSLMREEHVCMGSCVLGGL